MSRLLTIALSGLVLAGASPPPASAQGPQVDAKWHAWLGCWEPVQEQNVIGNAVAPNLCVVPSGTTAVDLVTVVGNQITGRERIDPNGQQVASAKDCPGYETARWSADGRRVYARASYTCPGNAHRTSNGLMTMAGSGEWLDVQAVAVSGRTGVRVIRYRAIPNPTTLPAEVASALQGIEGAASNARILASAPIEISEVVDASRNVEAPVVQAWLANRQQGFALSGKQLIQLASQGVPASTIDVLVALDNPRVFALTSSTREGDVRMVGGQNAAASSNNRPGPTAYINWDPYGYGYSRYGSQFGYYSPYGYQYGYLPGYGYYPGNRPIVIVPREPTDGGGSHGRVVNGRGYTRGGTRSGGTRSVDSGDRSSGGGGSSTAHGTSGGGSSATTGSSSSGSASSDGGAARTAKPRPPGN